MVCPKCFPKRRRRCQWVHSSIGACHDGTRTLTRNRRSVCSPLFSRFCDLRSSTVRASEEEPYLTSSDVWHTKGENICLLQNTGTGTQSILPYVCTPLFTPSCWLPSAQSKLLRQGATPNHEQTTRPNQW